MGGRRWFGAGPARRGHAARDAGHGWARRTADMRELSGQPETSVDRSVQTALTLDFKT
ncbi:hypothetical protein FRAHR75_320052 [Frankia sp. Hr75.2]|nr:hypothetical protein FRAHR75_320052 [Frankia sp. Hr75.2]